MKPSDAADNLSQHRVPGPPEAYYIADFVTEEEEHYLLRKITETPKHKWKNLANRRLQIWGGEITRNVLFQTDMPSYISAHPNLIQRLASLGAFGSSPHGAPNHVILNEYLPGQGIMPHEDGPAYHPVVATVSLGSHAVFHYYKYQGADNESGRAIDPNPVVSILLEPRSVIITRSSLYTSHLHGIEERDEDAFSIDPADGVLRLGHTSAPVANQNLLTANSLARLCASSSGRLKRETRCSLTCRDVAKVTTMRAFGR